MKIDPKYVINLSRRALAEEVERPDAVLRMADRAYRDGFNAALKMLAVWKDGEQTVGINRQSLDKAIAEAESMEVPARW